MYPSCISTVALIATGATSTGWLAALAMKLRARTGAKKIAQMVQTKGDRDESSSARRIAS
jgi:hypothetical protein